MATSAERAHEAVRQALRGLASGRSFEETASLLRRARAIAPTSQAGRYTTELLSRFDLPDPHLSTPAELAVDALRAGLTRDRLHDIAAWGAQGRLALVAARVDRRPTRQLEPTRSGLPHVASVGELALRALEELSGQRFRTDDAIRAYAATQEPYLPAPRRSPSAPYVPSGEALELLAGADTPQGMQAARAELRRRIASPDPGLGPLVRELLTLDAMTDVCLDAARVLPDVDAVAVVSWAAETGHPRAHEVARALLARARDGTTPPDMLIADYLAMGGAGEKAVTSMLGRFSIEDRISALEAVDLSMLEPGNAAAWDAMVARLVADTRPSDLDECLTLGDHVADILGAELGLALEGELCALGPTARAQARENVLAAARLELGRPRNPPTLAAPHGTAGHVVSVRIHDADADPPVPARTDRRLVGRALDPARFEAWLDALMTDAHAQTAEITLERDLDGTFHVQVRLSATPADPGQGTWADDGQHPLAPEGTPLDVMLARAVAHMASPNARQRIIVRYVPTP